MGMRDYASNPFKLGLFYYDVRHKHVIDKYTAKFT